MSPVLMKLIIEGSANAKHTSESCSLYRAIRTCLYCFVKGIIKKLHRNRNSSSNSSFPFHMLWRLVPSGILQLQNTFSGKPISNQATQSLVFANILLHLTCWV